MPQYPADVVSAEKTSCSSSTSIGLAMPVLPAMNGSSLTDVPIACRIVSAHGERGPGLSSLLQPLSETMRSCARADVDIAATAAAKITADVRALTIRSIPQQ